MLYTKRWNRAARILLGCLVSVALVALAGCGSDDGEGGGGSNINVPDQDTGTSSDTSGATDAETNDPIDATDGDDTSMTADGSEGDGASGSDGSMTGGDADVGVGDAGMDGGGDVDTVVTCGGQTCGTNEACFQGQCIPKKQAKCNNAKDLGSLQLDQTTTITGTFKGYNQDVMTTSCAGGMGPEKVYKFTVASHSQIDVSTTLKGEFDVKLEFRQGSCTGGLGEYGTCRDSDGSFFAPSGSTFYLVVENDIGNGGDFEIDLTPKASCSFGAYGDYGCKMGDRFLCERVNGKPNEKQFSCPAGCTDGDCIGTSCMNPIIVPASNGYSNTYKGDLAAYTPTMDFANAGTTCTVMGQKPNSPGAEVVFKVQGLKKGQKVEVDTTRDSNANLVYFTNNCSSSPSQLVCAGTGQDKATMTAQAAGDFYIFVDKYTSNVNNFEYRIKIR